MPASNPKEVKLDSDKSLDVSSTQSALEEIDECQNDIDALNEKASDEILTVEQKFNKLRRPHYTKRNGIIQKIPNFWCNAFINHPQISSVLNSEEEECLQSLTSVDVEEFEDIKSGYQLIFSFKENAFFTNDSLVKEFHLATSGKPRSKSTPINWKEGKDLTKIKQANGRKRPMMSSLGFFSWFLNNEDPNADEIAEVIKDDMWPNPLHYYLASDIDISAENGESDEDDDELDESIVEVGDDDDDDDDDEDDDSGEDNPEGDEEEDGAQAADGDDEDDE